MSFRQPLATPVHVHLIEDPQDWGCISSDTLKLLQLAQTEQLAQAVCDSQLSDDSLHSAILVTTRLTERLQALSQAEDCLPHLGRDPRTAIIGPFTTEVLQCVVPDSCTHFDAVYARAVYPCQAGETAIKWALPSSGRVASLLTLPVMLMAGTNSSGVEVASPPRETLRPCLSTRPRDGAQASVGYQESSHSSSASDTQRGSGDARLLIRRDTNVVPLGLLCVAEEDEIYSVMCSTLMQRRILGVHEPLLGFAFSPHSSYLQLLIGWLEESTTHACVQAHIAHAHPSSAGSHFGFGIFDVSLARSAWTLALFLIALRCQIISCAASAREHLERNRDSMDLRNVPSWRIDLIYQEDGPECEQRMRRWLEDCMFASPTPASMSLPPYNFTEGSRAPSSPHIVSRPPRSLHTIREDACYWADSKLQDRYTRLEEQQIRTAPIATRFHQRQAKSASSVARDLNTQRVDRPTELFIDRGVTFGAYPPIFAPLDDQDDFKGTLRKVFLPRVCDPEPLPRESSTPHELITKFDTGHCKMSRSTTTVGERVVLRPKHEYQWYGYLQEKAFEQIIRTAYRFECLEEVASSTRELVVHGLPHVLQISELVSRGHIFVRDPIEMESRHSWDAVIDLYLSGIRDERAGEGAPYHVHNRLERRIFLPRNILFDIVQGAEDSADVLAGAEAEASDEDDGQDGEDERAEKGAGEDNDAGPGEEHEPRPDREEGGSEEVEGDEGESEVEDDTEPPASVAVPQQPITAAAADLTYAGTGLFPYVYTPTASRLRNRGKQRADHNLIKQLTDEALQTLSKDSERLTDIVNQERANRLRRAGQYGQTSGPGEIKSALSARALSDFVYGVCDGLVFVEVPDVFTDDDKKFASELEDFSILAASAQVHSKFRAEGELDTEPSADDRLPPSTPSIVHTIREFAHKLKRDRTERGANDASGGHSPPVKVPASDDAVHDRGRQGSSRVRVSTHASSTPGVSPARAGRVASSASDEGMVSSCAPSTDDVPQQQTKRAYKIELTNWKCICLPILFREYKRGWIDPLQGLNQARIYILSGTDYYATMDMFGVVVFAIATVGAKGRLLCGWAEKNKDSSSPIRVIHHIIDTNCPEWDLSNSSDAIDFAIFLTLLRTQHIPDVVRRFEQVRPDFVGKWRAGRDSRKRFHWSMVHQRKYSKAYKEAKANKTAQENAYREIQREMDSIVVENTNLKVALEKTAADQQKILDDETKKKETADAKKRATQEKKKANRAAEEERRRKNAEAKLAQNEANRKARAERGIRRSQSRDTASTGSIM